MTFHMKKGALAGDPFSKSNQFVQAIGWSENSAERLSIQGSAARAPASLAPPFTSAELREWLHYDPVTGIWTNRLNRGGKAHAGTVAGTLWLGYRRISVNGKLYKSARLAYFYMTGAWLPPFLIMDHANGTRDDDRWTNLRPATYQQNGWNKPTTGTNKAGRLGVYPVSGGKWFAEIMVSGERIRLGRHATRQSAIEARQAAEREHFGAWAREAA